MGFVSAWISQNGGAWTFGCAASFDLVQRGGVGDRSGNRRLSLGPAAEKLAGVAGCTHCPMSGRIGLSAEARAVSLERTPSRARVFGVRQSGSCVSDLAEWKADPNRSTDAGS